MLRHGYFHSCVLHHIDSRHVSAFIVLLTLRERDVQFDADFPLLHAAHRHMQPALRERRRRQVQSYLYNRLALRLCTSWRMPGAEGSAGAVRNVCYA